MRKVIPVKGMQQHELDSLTWILEESTVLFHSLVDSVIDIFKALISALNAFSICWGIGCP